MHVQFLVTLTCPPPVFVVYLLLKTPWLIHFFFSFSFSFLLKHYFMSPGWNKGLNLKDWVQLFADASNMKILVKFVYSVSVFQNYI